MSLFTDCFPNEEQEGAGIPSLASSIPALSEIKSTMYEVGKNLIKGLKKRKQTGSGGVRRRKKRQVGKGVKSGTKRRSQSGNGSKRKKTSSVKRRQTGQGVRKRKNKSKK